jgi:uncharacterized protein YfdQ (DUF2303 family)
MADRTEFQSALDAAVGARNDLFDMGDGGEPLKFLPQGYQVVELEQYLARPLRKRASAVFTSLASFIEYVGAFKGDDTRIFADDRVGTVTALIDYHGAEPSWCEHKAVLTLRQTPEWQTWAGRSGKAMSQVDFAEFIEDNLPDILNPSGAEMLEIAKHLEAKRTVHFASGVNLSNGMIQLTYSEQEDGRVKGQVEVPQRFTLHLSPFEHAVPVAVPVRLRYRIADEKLTFTYIVDRPHKVLEEAIGRVLSAVEVELIQRPLIGSVTVPK